MQDLLQCHGRNELYQPICAGCCKYPVQQAHWLDVAVNTSLTASYCDIVLLLYAQRRLSGKRMHKQMQPLKYLECCNLDNSDLLSVATDTMDVCS